MKTLPSLAALATQLRRVAQAIPAAEHEGLQQAGKLIEAEAKALIGQEAPEWAPLEPATIAEKQRLGFTGKVSGTDPLLREGTLRESISHQVDGRKVVIGSDDPVAIYQETGTSHIPPRPFLAGAAFRKGEEAAKAIGKAIGRAVGGLPPERG